MSHILETPGFLANQGSLIRRGSQNSLLRQNSEKSLQTQQKPYDDVKSQTGPLHSSIYNSQYQGHQSHVIRELIPNPMQTAGVKRSLEIHLSDIMHTCSLKEFYRVKQIFQRNSFCSVTGVLLEIKNTEIQSSYMVSRKLRPSSESDGLSTAINDDKDNGQDKQEADEEFQDQPCAYLIKFSVFSPPHRSQSIYQRALPKDHKVTHCSVSDAYAIFAVIQETSQYTLDSQGEFDSIDKVNAELAKRTLLVVVDLKQKTEYVLKNPSQNRITAVYIDENILMVGSNSEAYHLTPQKLFIDEDRKEDFTESLIDSQGEGSKTFQKTQLPEAHRKNNEIYAFWNTQNTAKVDIFVKSTKISQVSVFQYRTPQAIEKIKMHRRRKSMKRQGYDESQVETENMQVEEMTLQREINLNIDFLSNRRLSLRQNQKDKTFLALGTLSEHDDEVNKYGSKRSAMPSGPVGNLQVEDSEDLSGDEKDKDEEQEAARIKRSDSLETSDDEDYVSDDEGKDGDQFLQVEKAFKKETFDLIAHSIEDNETNHQASTEKAQTNMSYFNNISSQKEPQSPTPALNKNKKRELRMKSTLEAADLSRQFSLNELKEPLMEQNQNKEGQQSPIKDWSSNIQEISDLYDKTVKIKNVKFYRRNTVVFRTDGQIDFIGSNNIVYSSRNIDFQKMKWEPATSPQVLKERRQYAPKILDVVFEEHDLLLITKEETVYLFNLERMTISLTKIKPEQAKLFTLNNRMQLFSDFIVYDNFVFVSHLNMISICDMNAKICREKQWRHLAPPLTDVLAEDRDTYNNEETRRDPFRFCNINVRMIKLREQKGTTVPRIMVLFQNNVIRMLARDEDMKWSYDQYSTKLVQGEVVNVICSKKQNSLVLLRHKEHADSPKSTLTIFYFQDAIEDQARWQVLDGLEDHQRVIQITLQNRFMQDFNKQSTRPMIGIYDDHLRQLIIYKLDTVEDIKKKDDPELQAVKTGSYGVFRPINKISDFRILSNDIILESGKEEYFYMARQNKIFKCYTSDEAVRKAQKEKYQMASMKEEKQIPDLSEYHPHLEVIAVIASRYQKYLALIEDFRIIQDNKTEYVYASTRSHIYFNQIDQFGKLFSGSKLLPPSLARCQYEFHVDDSYGQIGTFIGPFEILVLPFLSSNRISLRGAHHEPSPIFYQTRGYENLHMLTRNSEIKTWSTVTGKLKNCHKLDENKFMGYQRQNLFRNRTIMQRQNEQTMNFEYVCVEIVSKRKIIEFAKIVSSEQMNFYLNSNDNLIFTEHRGSKHNVFEVTQFNKKTGTIDNVLRTFNRSVPMNFLSPSFHHYIDIESHTHKIKVLDTFTDQVIQVLPSHLYKFMWSKQESFSTETFLHKIIFVDEDFILMELDGNNEIIFHVPSGRTVSSFNLISPNLKYNEKFFPVQYHVHKATPAKGPESLVALKRMNTSWISPKEAALKNQATTIARSDFMDPVKRQMTNLLQEKKENQNKNASNELLILEDFIYANMKRQRHIHFIEMQSVCTVVRDREGYRNADINNHQLKLISVRCFSYALWKLMDDISTERCIKINQVSRELLAALCFSFLPDSQGSFIRRVIASVKDQDQIKEINKQLQKAPPSSPTLLHKLVMKNPEEIKPLIEIMKREWPLLVMPHIYNLEGQTPMKLAQLTYHRRAIGWFLDMLKEYPMGYCQYQVSNLIFEFIDDGFELKVGQYLDNRFKTQKWIQHYQTGKLFILDSGINQTTTNNWPSKTQNLETKFFKQDCPQVPVKMKMLDCPNLHTFSKEETQSLLLALSNCDITVFSHRAIQCLIEYNWESTQGAIIGWLFVPFMAYMITYLIFLEILFMQDQEDDSSDLQLRLRNYMIVTQALLLVFAIYFIQLHVRQIVLHKCKMTMAMLWSSVDLVPLLANLVSIAISIINRGGGKSMIEIMKPIYACATLFLFLKLFYFLRYFREIGHLIRMVFEVMYLMRFFFIVFFCFIFTFASAFYAFTGGDMTYADQILFVFNITIRKSDTTWFHDGYELLLWFTFLLTSMFFTYIMLNLTVSMVKGFYDAQMRIKTESQYQVMTQLTLDCFPYIRAPKSERDLRPPEGTLEFVEQAEYLDREVTYFQFKLRRNSFCNQYLLVVETEQEDKSSLLSVDPDQAIKDLTKQVNSGFLGVQKQLQHQDEVITSQGSAGIATTASLKDHPEFEHAVEQAVAEQMQKFQENNAKEIAQLQESQQEILRLLSQLKKSDD